jgi:hypothetical protein
VQQAAVIAYEQLSDLQKVILHGEAVLRELPENAAVLVALARAYAETGVADKCIERAQALSSCSPERKGQKQTRLDGILKSSASRLSSI